MDVSYRTTRCNAKSDEVRRVLTDLNWLLWLIARRVLRAKTDNAMHDKWGARRTTANKASYTGRREEEKRWWNRVKFGVDGRWWVLKRSLRTWKQWEAWNGTSRQEVEGDGTAASVRGHAGSCWVVLVTAGHCWTCWYLLLVLATPLVPPLSGIDDCVGWAEHAPAKSGMADTRCWTVLSESRVTLANSQARLPFALSLHHSQLPSKRPLRAKRRARVCRSLRREMVGEHWAGCWFHHQHSTCLVSVTTRSGWLSRQMTTNGILRLLPRNHTGNDLELTPRQVNTPTKTHTALGSLHLPARLWYHATDMVPRYLTYRHCGLK